MLRAFAPAFAGRFEGLRRIDQQIKEPFRPEKTCNGRREKVRADAYPKLHQPRLKFTP